MLVRIAKTTHHTLISIVVDIQPTTHHKFGSVLSQFHLQGQYDYLYTHLLVYLLRSYLDM